MNERTFRLLVGIFVILVVAWVLTTLLPPRDDARGATGEIAAFFEGLNRSAVDALRMSSPAGEHELARGESRTGWLINGMDADSSNVARFWSVIEEADVGDLAASNPANHERLEIADQDAWRLEFDLGGDTRTLLVGAQGPRFATSYVRLPGADDVYVLEGDVRVHIRRQLDAWRNKRLLTVDTTLVARVEVERDGESLAIVRGDSAWTFEDGGEVLGGPIRDLMMDLHRVDAGGILAADDSLAVTEEAGSMTAIGPDGAVMARLTLGAGENDRWVRVAGDDVIYRLQAFRIPRMFPDRERLTPEAEEGG